MRIIDTHLHLIDLGRLTYPWLDEERRLRRDHTLDEYLAEAIPAGIESMLHMEVDVAEVDQERETEWVTSVGRGVVGAIAGCRPEHANFAAQLDRLGANPKVRGLRRTFHFTPDGLSQSPLFRENIRRLAAYKLSYDLCALPRQLPIIAALAAQAPDVQFVLDHCGIPNVKGGEFDPWSAHISALAKLPNVACKISGVIAYGRPEGATADDLRPFVEHCIGAFGWDRVVWGSDWPVCTLTANLTRWVETTLALIAGASADEKSALLSRNAIRIYRLTLLPQDAGVNG
jgi:predicted TIM-barrel fold metal-dependent hydrolase